MYMFTNSSSILTLVIASVLGFYVAPHLSLVSRNAGKAIRFASGALVLELALNFALPFLTSRLNGWPFPLQPWQLITPICSGLFWGCLAWAALSMIQTAKPKGIL